MGTNKIRVVGQNVENVSIDVRPEAMVDGLREAFLNTLGFNVNYYIDDNCDWQEKVAYGQNEWTTEFHRQSTRDEHKILEGLQKLRSHLVRKSIEDAE